MSYGFSVLGNSGQLVIDEDSMIMTQAFRGDIIVSPNGLLGPQYAYGYCHVTYPQVVATEYPPFVFAVPTPGVVPCGLGTFLHRGVEGAWTGFTVLVTKHIFAQDGSAMYAGFNTGWQYRVGSFGLPGDNGYADYGLRIMNEWSDITYDSAWPIIKFRGLMSAWVLQEFTRGYALNNYWGAADVSGDEDYVLAKGTHAWGYPDLTHGFMLSGMGSVATTVDRGSWEAPVNAVVTVGFPDGNRGNLWAVAFFGAAQHPSGDLSAMRNWNLLTADFSGT